MAFGSGAMTNSIEEIGHADCIFVIGSNTTENHPVIALEVKHAVRQGKAKLIVADPRKIELADLAHLHLQQKPGTDAALINGMLNVIISRGWLNRKFIEERTEGFEALAESLSDYMPEAVEKITGVRAADLVEAARLYAQAPNSSILYAMGITQHVAGTNNVLALANLAMATGQIGKPFSGVNPLRGQNNVQGACDMGGLPNVFTGYQRVDDDSVRQKFEKAWGVSLSPRPGLTLMEMMKGIAEGKVKALFILGENPLLSDPNATHVKKELKGLELLVTQDIFLSETAELSHVVLPGAGFAEKDGTFTNTERRVQRVRKAIDPVGNARADWRIIRDLSNRLGYPMNYASPKEIMDEIAALTPSYGGIRYDRLEGLGLQWPCPTLDHPGTPILHKDKFTRGKGKFHITPYAPAPELPDNEYPFLLTTGRVLYHYHTVMTRKSKGLSEIYPEGVIEVNPEDAKRLGIQPDNGLVKVTSRRGKLQVKAKISDSLPPGVVFMTFHFREAAANLL
ncbi:MAG: formate dehydrogenase, selenocysteine-containing, partial [Deltaproteobacteria bacterium]|nr:formate dehydrogenase, selenocysteine-containing [Deltaproteobacteria bacterium]